MNVPSLIAATILIAGSANPETWVDLGCRRGIQIEGTVLS